MSAQQVELTCSTLPIAAARAASQLRKGVQMPKGKKSKPKKDASSRGVTKHLRELERQLSSAARQEVKRVRKLEKSRHRRQELQAAVEQLRIEAGVSTPAAIASKAK